MHKTFKKKRYTLDQILLLSTSDFRKLGLAGMLMSLFDSSTLKAKEYYLYKTVDNKEHQEEMLADINRLVKERQDNIIKEKLAKAAKGKFIYNLHANSTLYGYIKRHARKRNMTINELISSFGFVYKSAKKDIMHIPAEKVWNLRKQRKTYIEIAEELDSNPTTINEMCMRHFGGDPLIPRPIHDYITVQELMNKYHVDHKTVMKLVKENRLENHTTIRFRYLKKVEIEPVLKKYIKNSLQHRAMVNRYAN
jgi:predicted transcriptional regulator